MHKSGDSTLTAFAAPTVLAIACPPEVIERLRRALEGIGVGLKECGFVAAPTEAARRRPLALVMLEDVYAFDPEELDALARDVNASLVRIEESTNEAMLELLLNAAIESAAARRNELLPLEPIEDAPPSVEPVEPPPDSAHSRRTAPDPGTLRSYQVGRRMPSRADVAAAAWPQSSGPPSSSGRRALVEPDM